MISFYSKLKQKASERKVTVKTSNVNLMQFYVNFLRIRCRVIGAHCYSQIRYTFFSLCRLIYETFCIIRCPNLRHCMKSRQKAILPDLFNALLYNGHLYVKRKKKLMNINVIHP